MSVVEEIKERLDIVDVISAYVPLRKAGRSYKALCPFHQEKTPSFVVFPETGTWRCFGACGTGGDLFAFIMKRENVDFREALEILAQKAGIDLASQSDVQSHQDRYRDHLREINLAAAVYFHSLLRDAAEAGSARDYVARRGLDEASIERFQIGYALQSWDGLLKHLRLLGFELEDILATGLVIEKEHDEGRISQYDRFRHRLVVPIRDVRGHVIGFGARSLSPDQQPKYLNTPQTPLFDKSRALFGLDLARKAIRARGQAIIVEGYMDVVAAHQFGEHNVVASMGTALTEQQLRQLKRYTNTFVLALDADTAGQAATLRGITQAREALDREWVPTITATGLLRHEARLAAELRIMTLPEGQDPDDVIRADLAAWQQLVAEAQPVVDFFLDLVRREEDLQSAQGKSAAVERLAPLIQEVADEVQRAHYVQQLARLVQTDERTVQRLVMRRRPAVALPPVEPPPVAWEDVDEEDYPVGSAAEGLSDMPPAVGRGLARMRPNPASHCLALLLLQPQLLPQLQTELAEVGTGPLDEDDFVRADERAVCVALLSGAIDDSGRWSGADPVVEDILERLRAYGERWPVLTRHQMLKDLVDSVLRLRISGLKAQARQLPAMAQEASTAGQQEEAREYLRLANDLRQHIHMLERALNSRTHSGRRQAIPAV